MISIQRGIWQFANQNFNDGFVPEWISSALPIFEFLLWNFFAELISLILMVDGMCICVEEWEVRGILFLLLAFLNFQVCEIEKETENVVEQRFNVAPGSKTLLQNPKTLPRRCARVYKDMFSDSVKYWKSFQQSSQVSLLKDYFTKKTRSRCPRRSVSTRSIDLLQDNFCFDDWRKRMIIMTTFSFLITLRSLVLCDC